LNTAFTFGNDAADTKIRIDLEILIQIMYHFLLRQAGFKGLAVLGAVRGLN